MLRLADMLDRTELDQAISGGLVTARELDGLVILNYSPAAAYTPGAWEVPIVRMCRGLIVTSDYEWVIARPWEKFFNYGQKEAGDLDLDAPVEVTDKLDGSLGIIYLHHGELRVATRGSMGSEQAIHATAWLRARRDPRLLTSRVEAVTPLVEIIYPENKIVCDYGERDELVLIGGVKIETGEYLSPDHTAWLVQWPYRIVDTFPHKTLREALEAPPRVGAEGLCVRFLGENRIVKIKQDDYVQLHRIVTGLSEKSVWRHALEHGTSDEVLQMLLDPLPDELHEWTRDKFSSISEAHDQIVTESREAHTEILMRLATLDRDWTRKDYAILATSQDKTEPGYMFMLLDGKDPSHAIIRSLEPRGSATPRDLEEE